jgi:hypothetical protein
MPKNKFSHDGLWGSNQQYFIKEAQSRKAFHLKTIIIINPERNAQGEDLFLIGFLSYRSLVVGRTGFRIVGCTFKRALE